MNRRATMALGELSRFGARVEGTTIFFAKERWEPGENVDLDSLVEEYLVAKLDEIEKGKSDTWEDKVDKLQERLRSLHGDVAEITDEFYHVIEQYQAEVEILEDNLAEATGDGKYTSGLLNALAHEASGMVLEGRDNVTDYLIRNVRKIAEPNVQQQQIFDEMKRVTQ